jgi:hypothetical protein
VLWLGRSVALACAVSGSGVGLGCSGLAVRSVIGSFNWMPPAGRTGAERCGWNTQPAHPKLSERPPGCAFSVCAAGGPKTSKSKRQICFAGDFHQQGCGCDEDSPHHPWHGEPGRSTQPTGARLKKGLRLGGGQIATTTHYGTWPSICGWLPRQPPRRTPVRG